MFIRKTLRSRLSKLKMYRDALGTMQMLFLTTPIIKQADILDNLPAKMTVADKNSCITELVRKKWLAVLSGNNSAYKVLALLKSERKERKSLDVKYLMYEKEIKAVLQNFSGYLSDLDEKSFSFTESSKSIEAMIKGENSRMMYFTPPPLFLLFARE